MNDAWRKILGTCGVRAYAFLVGLASLALTARVLGPEGRGILAAVLAWVHLGTTLGSLSIGQVILHHAATDRKKSWLGPSLGALVFLTIVLSLFVWLLAAVTATFRREVYGDLPSWALTLGLLAIPLYLWENYGANLLTYAGHLGFYNRVQLITISGGFLFLAVALLLFHGGVAGALIATLAATGLMSGTMLWKLSRLARASLTFDPNRVLALLRDGLKLHLNALGGVLLTVTNTLMINYYSSPEEVGFYQLASQMITAVMILPQAASRVFGEMTAESGPDRVWPNQKRLLGQLVSIMVGIMILGYFLAPWAVTLIAGKDFYPSVPVFRLLLLSVVGVSLSYGMSNQWLGRGLFLQTSVLTLAFGVANVLLNVALIPRYGMMGAAWSIAAVYGLGVLTNLAMVFYVQGQWRNQRLLGYERPL